MRLLCKWGEPNARDLYGVAPLHKAVAFGQVRRSVQLLHNDTTTQRHNYTCDGSAHHGSAHHGYPCDGR